MKYCRTEELNIKTRWNFIIAIIRLFEPEMVEIEEGSSFTDAITAVDHKCTFIELCEWARYE